MITPLRGPEIRSLMARIAEVDTSFDRSLVPATTGTVARITGACCPSEGQIVLKAGPNLGAYTLAMLAGGSKVIAVEHRPERADLLRGVVDGHCDHESSDLSIVPEPLQRVRRHHIKVNPTAALLSVSRGESAAAVLRVASEFPSIHTILVVSHRSDLRRLTAGPEHKLYSADSAKVAFHGKLRLRDDLHPRLVGSRVSVASFHRREAQLWPDGATFRDEVFNLVDIAFSKHRSSARMAYSQQAGSTAEAARWLLAASLLPTRDPSRFSIDDFVRLQLRRGGTSASEPDNQGAAASDAGSSDD